MSMYFRNGGTHCKSLSVLLFALSKDQEGEHRGMVIHYANNGIDAEVHAFYDGTLVTSFTVRY